MPIYAYRCTSCAHAKDVLQKVSDPLLSECPACGAPTFTKQVTAAGFQLKGSGWYATDFRGGNNGAAKPEAEGQGATAEKDGRKADPKGAEKTGEKSGEQGGDKGSGKSVEKTAAATPAAAAPAPGPSSPAPAPTGAASPATGG